MPAWGARISTRRSWSSAAILRSTSSATLALDLAQLLGDLAAQVLVDLHDLQRRLGDLALGLGGAAIELAALAVEPGLLALQRGQPGSWIRFLR